MSFGPCSGGRFPLALSVLQILALDIGTDLLPALALGSEAPSKGALKRPPERRHLMDRALMFRVFGLLGPVEALMEMTAYTAVLLGAGWTPGAELFLFVGPVAGLLDHAPPSPGGLAVALAAVPAVLLADWLYKVIRHRRAGAA